MSRWDDRPSDVARGQSGYVLLLVLGAIGLTSVVLVALLGLALTSSRVTVSQREMARDQRAAAGALEAAIGQFADGDPAAPCSALAAPPATTQQIELEPGADGTNRTVEVGCGESDLALAVPPAQPQPQLASTNLSLNAQTGRHHFGSVDGNAFDCIFVLPGCSRTFRTTWSSGSTAPLRSALLLLESDEGENVHNLNRKVTATIRTKAGPQCTVTLPGGRTNRWSGVYSTVDLFSSTSCRALLNNAPQTIFDQAVIDVTHAYAPSSPCPAFCTAALSVGKPRILTNVDVSEAASASGSGWNAAASVRTVDTISTHVLQPNCDNGDERCRYAHAGDVHTLSLSDFDLSGAGTGTTHSYIDSLGVVIDSPRNTPVRSWISDPIDQTWFEVKLSIGGSDCVAKEEGFARSHQQMYVDLLGKPGCRDALQTVDDLAEATLTYSVKTECGHYADPFTGWLQRAPVDSNGNCLSVRLPNLDRVALAITTVPVPRESLVTLTATIDGRKVAQADLYFDGKPAPRPTPVVSWRYENFTDPPPPTATP